MKTVPKNEIVKEFNSQKRREARIAEATRRRIAAERKKKLQSTDAVARAQARKAALPVYVRCYCGAQSVSPRYGGVFGNGHSATACRWQDTPEYDDKSLDLELRAP